MVSRRNKTLLSLSIFIGVLAWNVAAAAVKGETGRVPVGQLSVHEIEEQLQVSAEFNVHMILAGSRLVS
jgi:zinc transporter 7